MYNGNMSELQSVVPNKDLRGDGEAQRNETRAGFHERLSGLPFIEQGNLCAFLSVRDRSLGLMEVGVDAIVSGPYGSSWDLLDRGQDYVLDFAEAIREGKVDLGRMEPPVLFELGGLYGVFYDGRHRVAALKGLGEEGVAIKAEVRSLSVEEVSVFKREDFEALELRRREGFWQGTLEGGEKEDSPTGFFAKGRVEAYEGPWVFARDMELARRIYQTLRPDLYPIKT